MVPTDNTQQLGQQARKAARAAIDKRGDVRVAVRDLTLHALRSRMLTAAHLADVTKAVAEGIAGTAGEPAAQAREAARHAFTGLAEAVSKALFALELAAREFAEGSGRLGRAEAEGLLAEIATLEKALGEGWRHDHAPPPSDVGERLAALSAHLRRAAGDASREAAGVVAGDISKGAREGADAVAGAGRVLGLVASGALLALSEALRESAAPRRG